MTEPCDGKSEDQYCKHVETAEPETLTVCAECRRELPPKPQPVRRSAPFLVSYQEHIAYEVDMLVGTAACLARYPQEPVECSPLRRQWTIQRNALIESFVVHFRVLTSFLFDGMNGGHSQGVFAQDFFGFAPDGRDTGRSWKKIRSGKLPASQSAPRQEAVRRANIQVTHLLERRGEEGVPRWNLVEVLGWLRPPFQLFVKETTKLARESSADFSVLEAALDHLVNLEAALTKVPPAELPAEAVRGLMTQPFIPPPPPGPIVPGLPDSAFLGLPPGMFKTDVRTTALPPSSRLDQQ